jgi:hypothetical protein
MNQYEVWFYLPTGNSPRQMAVITASDSGAARKIFSASHPGCRISEVKQVRK